jgi:hypothetical protein
VAWVYLLMQNTAYFVAYVVAFRQRFIHFLAQRHRRVKTIFPPPGERNKECDPVTEFWSCADLPGHLILHRFLFLPSRGSSGTSIQTPALLWATSYLFDCTEAEALTCNRGSVGVGYAQRSIARYGALSWYRICGMPNRPWCGPRRLRQTSCPSDPDNKLSGPPPPIYRIWAVIDALVCKVEPIHG